MTLGQKIKQLRESNNISQKELANLLGVGVGNIAEWEADELHPSIVELSRVSKVLSVSLDEFVEEKLVFK